jgi:glutathione S-transferase
MGVAPRESSIHGRGVSFFRAAWVRVMMLLYDIERSGNCYKVRLFLSLLGIDYDRHPVDTRSGEDKSAAFLSLNPRGLVPVLVDGEQVITDSNAVLVYLARRYGGEAWLPLEPLAMSDVVRWLIMEQSEGRYGLARARAMALRNPGFLPATGSLEESRTFGRMALEELQRQLVRTPWLVGVRPTVADIACYPYAAMSPQGGIELDPYPALGAWIARMQALPGYVDLPPIPSRDQADRRGTDCQPPS